MADQKYYDSTDTERTNPLSRQQAAQVQMGGHAVVDEDGQPATLYAYDVLHGREAVTGEVSADQLDREALKANGGEARDAWQEQADENAADGGDEPERLTIPQLKEQIADLSDEDLDSYANDDRKGAQEAAKAEQARRAEAAEADEKNEDENSTASGAEGVEAAVQGVLESQQAASNRPPDSDEAQALLAQATVGGDSGDATVEGVVEDDGSPGDKEFDPDAAADEKDSEDEDK